MIVDGWGLDFGLGFGDGWGVGVTMGAGEAEVGEDPTDGAGLEDAGLGFTEAPLDLALWGLVRAGSPGAVSALADSPRNPSPRKEVTRAEMAAPAAPRRPRAPVYPPRSSLRAVLARREAAEASPRKAAASELRREA